MPANIKPQLTHMAIFVKDMAKMKEFYSSVFGLTVTDEGPHPMVPVDMVFLSASPTEHHQFVLISGRPDDVEFNIAQQMSFLVQSLGELRGMRDRITAAGLEVKRACTHGNAWSIYFDDPEGNQIEVYVHSPWYITQPHIHLIDLDQSDEEIMRLTEAHCRDSAGFMPAAEREAKMRQMMGLA